MKLLFFNIKWLLKGIGFFVLGQLLLISSVKAQMQAIQGFSCYQKLSDPHQLNLQELDKLEQQIAILLNGQTLNLAGFRPRDKVKQALFLWLGQQKQPLEIKWRWVTDDFEVIDHTGKFRVSSVDNDYVTLKPYISARLNHEGANDHRIFGKIQILTNDILSVKLFEELKNLRTFLTVEALHCGTFYCPTPTIQDIGQLLTFS